MFRTPKLTPEAESVISLRGQLREIEDKIAYHTSNLPRKSNALRNVSTALSRQTPGVTLLGETLATIGRKRAKEEQVKEGLFQLGRLKNTRTELVNRTRQLQWGGV